MEVKPLGQQMGKEGSLPFCILLQLFSLRMLKYPGTIDAMLPVSKQKYEQDKMEAGLQYV